MIKIKPMIDAALKDRANEAQILRLRLIDEHANILMRELCEALPDWQAKLIATAIEGLIKAYVEPQPPVTRSSLRSAG